MDDSSYVECIDELIKRNNPAVRRAIDSMARARAALSSVRSPWQQEMDEMVAHDELEMPGLQEKLHDSDNNGDDTNDLDSSDDDDDGVGIVVPLPLL